MSTTSRASLLGVLVRHRSPISDLHERSRPGSSTAHACYTTGVSGSFAPEGTVPLRTAAQQELFVSIYEPSQASREVALEQGVVTIGRLGGGAKLALDDPAVSREHARLVVGDDLKVEDLGSSNGTRCHGKRIAARQPVLIRHDEAVIVGATTLIVHWGTRVLVPSTAAPLVEGETLRRVELFAVNPLDLLIVGEPGVGKTQLARWVHERSRARGPLVEVACRGRDAQALEAELVGGLAAARGGTLVIDDIPDLPLELQDTLQGELRRRGPTGSEADGPRPRMVATSRLPFAEGVRLGRAAQRLEVLAGLVGRRARSASRPATRVPGDCGRNPSGDGNDLTRGAARFG